jgi:hypothetical protein
VSAGPKPIKWRELHMAWQSKQPKRALFLSSFSLCCWALTCTGQLPLKNMRRASLTARGAWGTQQVVSWRTGRRGRGCTRAVTTRPPRARRGSVAPPGVKKTPRGWGRGGLCTSCMQCTQVHFSITVLYIYIHTHNLGHHLENLANNH